MQTQAGDIRAGLHEATGGDGTDACSGDMLLHAVLACAGVTLRSVACAVGVELRHARLTAESAFDARGALGVDRTVQVGVGPITVVVDAETTADDAALLRLAELTERHCVVGQSLAQPPTIVVRRTADPGWLSAGPGSPAALPAEPGPPPDGLQSGSCHRS